MKSFITWRLNFYRFKWWRRVVGIPEPLTTTQYLERLKLSGIRIDYENFWRVSPTADVIPIRRPTPFKANQKDRYL